MTAHPRVGHSHGVLYRCSNSQAKGQGQGSPHPAPRPWSPVLPQGPAPVPTPALTAVAPGSWDPRKAWSRVSQGLGALGAGREDSSLT